jgi:hypothetical protein
LNIAASSFLSPKTLEIEPVNVIRPITAYESTPGGNPMTRGEWPCRQDPRALEAPPPEKRTASEAAIARSDAWRATPDSRAQQEDVIPKVRDEFPLLAIDPELVKALSAPRAERHCLGLSLSDL